MFRCFDVLLFDGFILIFRLGFMFSGFGVVIAWCGWESLLTACFGIVF